MNKTKLKFGLVMLLCLTLTRVYAASSEERTTIYSYSFANGIASPWTNYSNRWVAEYINYVRYAVLNYSNLSDGQSASISMSYTFNVFYKEFQAVIESPDNLAELEGFTVSVNNQNTIIQAIPGEENKYLCTFDMNFPRYRLNMSLTGRKNSSQTGKIRIKSVKVTGIKLYDPNNIPSTYISVNNLADVYNVPADCFVKLDVTGCENKASNPSASLWYLVDNTSGLVVDNFNTWTLEEGVDIPGVGKFAGTMYGYVSKKEGVTSLVGISFQTNWDYWGGFEEPTEIKPIEITKSDYLSGNYLGKFISMPIDEDYYLSDPMWAMSPNKGKETIKTPRENGNYRICGIAYNNPDGKIHIGHIPNQPYSFQYQIYNEDVDVENDYTFKGSCVVKRNLVADKWHTLVLPFNFGSFRGEVAEYVQSALGMLIFEKTDTIMAGQPFLFKPYEDITELVGRCNTSLSDQNAVGMGDYKFVGTFNAVQPGKGCYYLTADNTIRPLSNTGTIKGLHAYFQPATSNPAQARGINLDGITTSIECVDVDIVPFGDNLKIYSVSGQYLGSNFDALPKGIYVINNKKVTK